jgi:hypothetical protein
MGQFVDKGYLGFARQDGLHIHFFHRNAAVFLPTPGDDLQPFSQFGDIGPVMGFNKPDNDVDPIIFKPVTFL